MHYSKILIIFFLISKYKDIKVDKITKLLDLYFKKYDRFLTFEETLVDVFNEIKEDANYKDKTKEWKVFLYSKNSDLKEKI